MNKRVISICLILLFIIGNIYFPSDAYYPRAKKISKQQYGVFLNLNKQNIKKLYKYKTVVIDAQFFTKKEISDIKKHKVKVYSYINIGSLEKFRPYYNKFKNLTLGRYENWDEERWINVASKSWQNFITGNLAHKLLKKGISGFFVDNCDVYYNYPRKNIYIGLIKILQALRRKNTSVIINGGDTFISKYMLSHKNLKSILTGINQECVFTAIDFDHNTTIEQKTSVKNYFLKYLSKLKKHNTKIYLLEYTKKKSVIDKINTYCKKHKYIYYASPDIELR